MNELAECAKQIDEVQLVIKNMTMADWLKQLFPELIPKDLEETANKINQEKEKEEECGVCFEHFRTEELVICSANCSGRLCITCASRIQRGNQYDPSDYRCPFCRAGLWAPIKSHQQPASESDDDEDDDEDEEVVLSRREVLVPGSQSQRQALADYRQAIEDVDNSPGL